MSETVNAPTPMTVPPKFKPAVVFPRGTAPVVRAAERAAARGPGAVEGFWRAAERTGTPVVEETGTPGERTATFLWRGGDGLSDVILVADRSADARSFERNRMERVPGSDIWHLTYRMRSDWRCSYAVAPVPADGSPPPPGPANEMSRVRRARALSAADPADAPAIARWFDALAHARPDPLARERLDGAWSVASLPDAPAELWRTAPGRAPQGRVDGRELASKALGNTRTVRVYTPAAEPPEGGWPVAVLLDGEEWWSLPLAPLLDRLIAAGALPPMLVAMVPSLGFATRTRELACHDPFVEFLTGSVLPLLRAEHGGCADPRRTLVAGQSLGGLTALYTAHRAPEHVGRALSQSGSYWWPNPGGTGGDTERMARLLAEAPSLPDRIHLSVGLNEPILVGPNRRLRDVLRERGADLHYTEFNGGHDRACWRAGLPDALAALTGDWPAARR
ncbi:enterochelin esterase [Nocardiopsis sp. CNT-189]|uniref:enterochelin esterase n=1 Tax=Nocardiopsis oceanisediminis TaxID=2816862 RepID=UPI003B3ABFD3